MDSASSRHAAVAAARQGDFDSALAELERLHALSPTDPLVVADRLTVLLWAGQPEHTVAVASTVDLEALPTYGGQAVAKALRDLQRYAESEAIWRRLMAREPERWQHRLGLAMTVADAGQTAVAEALCEGLVETRSELEVLVGCAFVSRRIGAFLNAVALAEKALALEPDHAEAFKIKVLSLSDLGAVHLARTEAKRREGVLSREESRYLSAQAAARQVIWGELGTLDPRQRFDETDAAIAALEQQIQAEGADRQASRLDFDRLVALRDRARMEDVITSYDELVYRREALPPYALNAVADAYLYERSPAEAAQRYRDVLAADAGGFATRMALYWALLEDEELDEAEDWLAQQIDEQAPWRRRAGTVDILPNWNRLTAESIAALHFGFTDRQREAQSRLQKLVDRAPFNTSLHEQLAGVLAFRGWAHRALEQITIALHFEPGHTAAKRLRAALLLDLHQYDEAERLSDELVATYPENQHVQQLAARARLRHRWHLEMESVFGQTEAAGPSGFGTDDRRSEVYLWAPTIGDFRPYLHHHENRAELPEGPVSYRRLSLGVHGRRGPLWGRLEAGIDRDRTDDASVSLSLGYEPNDHWRFGLSHSTDPFALPLRARRADISGYQSAASIEYRGSDLWHAGGTLALSTYSDDNRRRELNLFTESRVYTGPIYKSSLRLDLSFSDNSRLDAPYYNPRRDRTALLSWIHEWLGHRHYDRALVHRFVIAGGQYDQADFGSDDLVQLRYEHDWRVHLGAVVRYGLAWSSWVYDGEREERTFAYANLGWHF